MGCYEFLEPKLAWAGGESGGMRGVEGGLDISSLKKLNKLVLNGSISFGIGYLVKPFSFYH